VQNWALTHGNMVKPSQNAIALIMFNKFANPLNSISVLSLANLQQHLVFDRKYRKFPLNIN